MAALAICAAFSLFACSLGIRDNSAHLRIVCIVPAEISSAETKRIEGKSIGPTSGCKIGSYRLTFTSKSGETITKTLGRGAEEVRLKVGEWDLTAEGLTPDGTKLLEKTLHLNAEAGKTVSVPISLHLAKGSGELDLTFSPSQAPSIGWKYSVSLTYRGLPGDTTFSGPQPYTYDIPASEASMSATDIPSGIYTIAVRLLDASAAVVAGSTATALVAPGQVSSGICVIALSNPSIDISVSAPTLELSARATMGVDRSISSASPMSVPLAISTTSSTLRSEWYANGARISTPIESAGELLSGSAFFVSTIGASTGLSSVRTDVILSDEATFTAQSLSTTNFLAMGPSNDIIEWVQSIDYRAALSPPLVDTLDASNSGTGELYSAKWVATSSSGLIAVLGLDKSSALHLLYSPAGKEAKTESGSGTIIPSSVGWIRLWRDRVVVDKSERSPDRACLSTDGTRLAVAGSTSDWLRVYALDSGGEILSKTDMISTKDGAPSFENIKSMRFSADGKLLFVLVNKPEKIMVFDVEKFIAGQCGIESEFLFSTCFDPDNLPTVTLGMEDMELLKDGWIAACSSNVSRLYFVRYMEADSLFSDYSSYASGANVESLGDPRSIAFDPVSGLCFVLGYSKKLHVAAEADSVTGYSLISTQSLNPDFEKASSLAMTKNASGSTFLGVAGGTVLGIVSLDSSGMPLFQTSLANSGEFAAIESVNNVAVLGDGFITSGGANGLVSLFRLR